MIPFRPSGPMIRSTSSAAAFGSCGATVPRPANLAGRSRTIADSALLNSRASRMAAAGRYGCTPGGLRLRTAMSWLMVSISLMRVEIEKRRSHRLRVLNRAHQVHFGLIAGQHVEIVRGPQEGP